MKATCLALALCAAGVASAEPPAKPPPAMIDTAPDRQGLAVPLEKLIETDELGPEENFKVREVFRDEDTSHHLVWLRGAESSHRHDTHALTVIILRGWGSMRIGTDRRLVGPGSVVYVPRGAVHAFHNESGAISVAYAIYSPPYDGKDRIEDQ
jgi:mannose-6-phosphate isomerase-like protein (cupin superfamily)